MDHPDEAPEPVLVPVLRPEDLTKQTLWYLAAQGNLKARQALQDGAS
jgi:hypothetical protein